MITGRGDTFTDSIDGDSLGPNQGRPPPSVIEQYTGVLAAADVNTAHTALWVLESIRLDRGVGIHVRP